MKSLQRIAFDEAAKAGRRRDCAHEWVQTARMRLGDRLYLTKRCVRCEALKPYGAGRRARGGY